MLNIETLIDRDERVNINLHLSSLRIADLELFISASHLKNLSKAANLCNLSQSAASTAIQRVEYALGKRLCSHEKRNFSLTPEALAMLPILENWLRQLKSIVLSNKTFPIRFCTTHAIAQIVTADLLELGDIEFNFMRPDLAYESIINDKADIALVLDNSPWRGVVTAEISRGVFQLYSREKDTMKKPVLVPENQMEVLFLKQSFLQIYKRLLPVKATISSWSLIADICKTSYEVGFLPDFLAKKYDLHPVSWQPDTFQYRILAIHKRIENLEDRFNLIIKRLKDLLN